MTDAVDGNANTTGDISGKVVQAHTVNHMYVGDPQQKPPRLARAVIVIGVVVALAVAVVVAVYLQKDGEQQAATPTTSVATSPSSVSTTEPAASSAPVAPVVVGTGTLPTGGPGQPVQRQQQTAQPTVAPPLPQPTGPAKPATDGPGYLVPAGNDQRAADFYQNSWNDVVMWERHPANDSTSFQPFWAREFSDANPAVFRIRNQRGNLCMEPVDQENFGEHIKANACSWGNNAQLWQTLNTTQLAHVASGRCLGTANGGTYENGTWLIVSLCSGSDDQKWRITR